MVAAARKAVQVLNRLIISLNSLEKMDANGLLLTKKKSVFLKEN